MSAVARRTTAFNPTRPIVHAWRVTDREITAAERHVTINLDQISSLMPHLAPGAHGTAWRSYVSPVDDTTPDLPRLFYELALTISQFGGFIDRGLGGGVEQWKLQGSGVRALLATMHAIRVARLLPGIDIHCRYREQLTCYFMHSTFVRQRTEIMSELATKAGVPFFARHLASARRQDGSYCFNTLHMTGLAQCLPLSFGGDAPFFKKASLLLMTMEIALNDLGFAARSMTPPPADYRIPQILNGLGILRFSPALDAKIAQHHLFGHADPEVRAVRMMTVEAMGHIRHAYQRCHGTPIGSAALDGSMYMLSRNDRLMSQPSMRPHINVATLAF